ncbi:hypothetical protein BKA70DRAFT_1252784 [Coprinopsis sp. MPI-PUGE-AT-0042]|nr:hypothetical protein BKA70DRAFT_1252784 [Coprinopsis sp. MPI-PUGE-AT-0042]
MPSPTQPGVNARPAPSGATLSRKTIDARVKVLRAQIKASKKEIKRLSALRNDLSPISQLPTELLVRIFSEVIVTVGYESQWPRRKVPSWMVLTHVCQRWRVVALDASTLWTGISFDWSSHWVEAMLQRSKQAKLNIVLSSSGTATKAFENIKRSLDTSRLRSLTAKGSSCAHAIVARLGSGAPHLEKLSLTNYREAYTLPPGFHGRNTPNLKTLELEGWSLPSWRSPHFTTLRHFDLTINGPNPADPSGIELIDALDSMPTLLSLRLVGSHIPLINDEIRRTVHLPRLETLTVNNVGVRTGTALLNALAVPLTAKIDVSCHVKDEDSRAINDLGSAFGNCCLVSPLNPSATSPPTFKYISLRVGWSVDLTASLQHPPAGLHSLRMYSGATDAAENSIPHLLESLPLDDVCRIDFTGKSARPAIDTTPLFQLPRVETIHITDTEAATLFLEKAGLDTIFDDPYIRLPALKNLSFFEVDFKHDPRRLEAMKPSDLTSFLGARKMMGVEIQRLRLVNCPMYKKDKAKFKPQCRAFEVSDGDGED